MQNLLKVKKLNDKAIIPTRATSGSAGLDLYACINKDIIIYPKKLVIIPTGISIQLESKQYASFIYARSGLGIKHGICLSNGVGVVDSDYTGEICVGLCNVSETEYTIRYGDRIAQMVIQPVITPEVLEVDKIDKTIRGEKGFGSSGI